MWFECTCLGGSLQQTLLSTQDSTSMSWFNYIGFILPGLYFKIFRRPDPIINTHSKTTQFTALPTLNPHYDTQECFFHTLKYSESPEIVPGGKGVFGMRKMLTRGISLKFLIAVYLDWCVHCFIRMFYNLRFIRLRNFKTLRIYEEKKNSQLPAMKNLSPGKKHKLH